VLTQGTGGVSIFAIQLAKAMGARVIATTSNPEKADRLRGLGADHVIDYKANPAWGEEARVITLGRGVDRIVEVGGPGTLPQSVKAVAYGGQISLVGILGGAEGGVEFMAMFLSLARFQPIVVGSRRDLEDMIRVMSQHHIKPLIDSAYDFGDVRNAWDHYVARQLFGKVVIRH
jgi:NADPH:quinone reductase-like Zn-dependent oxidoreductase